MNVLLHSCCGPCTIYPLKVLREKGHSFSSYFYNPNIHPFREFKKRISSFRELVTIENVPHIIDANYGLRQFIRQTAFNEKKPCLICYRIRLDHVARIAQEKGFDSFSTTLLYSRYQQHSAISRICEDLAQLYQINFFYHDFREGWQYGIDESISRNLYRQPYCGCIYSEEERYDKKFRKRKNG